MARPEDYQRQLTSILEDVCAASDRVQRDAADVTVIGVTKSVGPAEIAPLLAAGVSHFGENRWQQARDKLLLPEAAQATWHFIGRLQENKVKYVVPKFDWIHSLDSLELAQAVSAMAQKFGRTVRCLVQVNVSGEETKAGVAPDIAAGMIESLLTLPGISVRGLMTMAPQAADVERTRSVFAGLRTLLKDIRDRTGELQLQELSMGMSNDFAIAVEEGATFIRVGQRLVGTSSIADMRKE